MLEGIDINTLRGLGTVFALVAFISVCLWAYSSRRKASFDEAANLPFADADADEGDDGDISNSGV